MRILVVDDDADTSDMLAEALGRRGHQVEHVYSGDEAIASLAHFTPEVAILDLAMPGMDGYQLGMALGARVPGLHLIALTGLAGGVFEDPARLRRAGFARSFAKPSTVAELADHLGAIARDRDR